MEGPSFAQLCPPLAIPKHTPSSHGDVFRDLSSLHKNIEYYHNDPSHSHMQTMVLDGAGIWIPTFARTQSPSFVGVLIKPAPCFADWLLKYKYIYIYIYIYHSVVPPIPKWQKLHQHNSPLAPCSPTHRPALCALWRWRSQGRFGSWGGSWSHDIHIYLYLHIFSFINGKLETWRGLSMIILHSWIFLDR